MLSINTNLSSMIAQNSLTQSTSKLNQAIERMSTGFKINHSSDNAANYSISTNMTTKMNAYMVAEDNTAMGLDLVTTASSSLDLISGHLRRLRDLAEQASNGTYGKDSLKVINSEVNSRIEEIYRLYSSTEFNGIALYDEAKGAGCDMESLPEILGTGFILEIEKRDTSEMKTLASVDISAALTEGTYSISTPEELAKLATMTNNCLIGEDTEFVLANDIDLSGYSNWTPIGDSYLNNHCFKGDFDGNGYTINNLKINNADKVDIGLFGCTIDAEIKNLGVKDVEILGKGSVAALIGRSFSTIVLNCFSTGNISGKGATGGLIGNCFSDIDVDSCYSKANIHGIYENGYLYNGQFGGLLGQLHGTVKNSFAIGNVILEANVRSAGGLIGQADGTIQNCYAKGNVTGSHSVGGLIGTLIQQDFKNNLIENCYSDGNIKLLPGDYYSGDYAGGIFACGSKTIVNNCSTACTIQTDLADSYELFSIGGGRAINDTYYENSKIMNCLYDGTQNSGINISSDNVLTENVFDSSKINKDKEINIQAGIYANENSIITFLSSFELSGIYKLSNIGLKNQDFLSTIDKILTEIAAKQVEYGAVQNRLESALDEIAIQYDNLASSRSTLRDADMAELSSEYIKMQILQQASATLLSTANQSPSIALQLI